ncbi:F0F1 ATP synthase subunit alpha, partial [Mycoplasmopsis pullorum]
LLKQEQYSPISQVAQAVILLGVKERIINPLPKENIHEYRDAIIKYLEGNTEGHTIFEEINETKVISPENYKTLEKALVHIVKDIIASIPNYDPQKYKPFPKKFNEVK